MEKVRKVETEKKSHVKYPSRESVPKTRRTRAKHAVKFFVLARVTISRDSPPLRPLFLLCDANGRNRRICSGRLSRDLLGKKTGCPSATQRLMNAVLEAEAH